MMATFVKIYAHNRRTGELLVGEIEKHQRWAACIVCQRGVPVGRRCHGYHYTKEQPAARRVRLLAPDHDPKP